MRSKFRTWFSGGLLLLAATAWFWPHTPPSHPDAPKLEKKLLILHPENAAKHQSSTAISPSTPEISDTPHPYSRTFPYRLANTKADMDALTRSEHSILLRNAFWDTRKSGSISVPETLRSDENPESYIVQAKGVVNDEFRDALRQVGASIISYVPNNAYLVRCSENSSVQLRSNPGVQAVLPYEPYYKLEPRLLALAVNQEPLPQSTILNVTLFPGVEMEARQALEKAGAEVLAQSSTPFGPLMTLRPAVESLATIARLSQVQDISTYRPRAFLNDLSRQRIQVSPDTTNAQNYLGLTGTNIMVAINDSGVDAKHPDLENRVFALRPQDLTDTNGHGTHVAGIIVGNGSQSSTVTNAPGSVPGANFRGMAPAAKLYVLPAESTSGPIISDAYLQENAAKTNAFISNNSWGYVGNREYDIAAASYDAAVRDSLPEQTGSQSMIYVFSAGNMGAGNEDGTGGESGTVDSPATAKNVITVGSLDQLRNITNETTIPSVLGTLTNQPFATDTDSDDQVSVFSARGNVGVGTEGQGGRFKPDVVAPGAFVVSTRPAGWKIDTNPPRRVQNGFEDLTIAPGNLDAFSIYVPTNTVGLEILVTPSGDTNSFPGLRLYTKDGDYPSATFYDATGVNRLTFPADYAITPGDLYYSVGNDSGNFVSYNIQTTLILTNAFGDFYIALSDLDDGLGPYYRFSSGTSMSAAAVSGMLALMQEYFEQMVPSADRRTNSPALMKALVINGARSTSPRYDLQVDKSLNIQGWGLVNLTNSIPAAMMDGKLSESPLQFMDQEMTNALATGESKTWQLTMTEQALELPLRATLVWTDPPGNPNAAIKLVNDLDLIITNLDTGEFYYGNDIPNGSDYNQVSYPGSELNSDNVNNVENVFIRTPSTNYSLTIFARRVNVNALPEMSPDRVVQDFALVISSGNLQLTNAFTISTFRGISTNASSSTNGIGSTNVVVSTNTVITTNATAAVQRPPFNYITNGVPLLNQRIGANAPFLTTTNGITNQWNFYIFTNTYVENSSFSLTNGSNVAFITFMPPNLSRPRNEEADIDMYVSTNSALTNLDQAIVASAFKSQSRGGTELVFFTNAPLDVIYYVGVKCEDQQGAEYGFVGLSSNRPFDEDSGDGRVMHAMPYNLDIPDGSAERPEAAMAFAIGTRSYVIGRAVVTNIISHQDLGDLSIILTHGRQDVVLHNHSLDIVPGFTNFVVYDDSQQGNIFIGRPTDGPGKLTDFMTENSSGVWIINLMDNSLNHTGRLNSLDIFIDPQPNANGTLSSVAPNSYQYFYIDVPQEATNLLVKMWDIDPALPLNVYVKREEVPSFDSFDKSSLIDPALILDWSQPVLTLGKGDVPPLNAGRYHVAVYNPNSVTIDFRISLELEYDLNASLVQSFVSTNQINLNDDAVIFLTNNVPVNKKVLDVRVGLRVDHPRASDLAVHLISPTGTRLLLTENRGGTLTNGFGIGSMTNGVGYLAFTDNTNLTDTLIKFAQGPYTNGFYQSNRFTESFESAQVTLYNTNTSVAGWTVFTNDVQILSDPALAQNGSKLLDLRSGGVSQDILTVSGASYLLNFGYRSSPAASGIISWWTGDQGSTNQFIDVVDGNVGNSVGGVTNISGYIGNAMSFNGTNGHIVVNNSANLNVTNFSFEAWIFPLDVTTPRPIFEFQPKTGYGGVGLWVGTDGTNAKSGVLTVSLPEFTGSGNRPVQHFLSTPLNTITNNAWNHVAVTFDQTTGQTRLMVNGTSKALGYFSNVLPFTGSLNLVIGHRLAGSLDAFAGSRFYGMIDELTLYNRALSPGEVRKVWQVGSAGKGGIPGAPVQAQFTIPGVMTNLYNASNNWQTASVAFNAPSNRVHVEFKALTTGMLIDNIQLIELGTMTYYQPEESLETLIDQSGYGNWQLEIWDSRTGGILTNTNSVISWQLQIIFATPAPPTVTLTNHLSYSSTVIGDEIKYFIVNTPRAARFATNTLTGTGDLILLVNNNGIPTGNPLTDDYYVNQRGSGQGEYLLLSTNTAAGPPLRPGQRYYMGVMNQNTNETNSFTIRVDFDQEDPLFFLQAIVLTNGVSRTNIIANGTSLDYYRFQVSPQATSARFELIPSNGNVNLLLRRLQQVMNPLPSINRYDYHSNNTGTNIDEIIITTNSFPYPLTSGDWLLGVYNMENYPVNYTIRATEFTNLLYRIIDLTNSVPLSYQVDPGGITDYFRVRIRDTNSFASFDLYNLTGNADLILRRGQLPSLVAHDAASMNPSIFDERITLNTNGVPTILTQLTNITMNPVMARTTNGVTFTWNSELGVTYVLKGKTQLTDSNWVDVSPALTSQGNILSYELLLPTAFRFFEVAGFAPKPSDLIQKDLNDDWYLAVVNRELAPVSFRLKASVTPNYLPLTNQFFGTNTLIAGPSWHYYRYVVSSNATMALFRAQPLQGDIALFIRKALTVPEPWPSQIAHDYASDQPALTPEEIFVTTNSWPTPLSEGIWYLGVFNPTTNAVSYDLSVIESYEPVPKFVVLTNAIPFTNSIVAPGLVDYYQFHVSTNASEAIFETLNADGNVDLYIKRSLPLPGPGLSDYASTNSGSANERISITRGSLPMALTPGSWFIAVSNASLTNVTYTLKASEITAANPITEVHIYPRPVITNGNFVLTWDSVVGAVYRIEGKARLNDGSWNILQSNYIAVSLISSYSIPLTNANRFFRVVALSGGSTPAVPQTPAVINSKPVFTNGSLTITWSSTIGASYRVEGKVRANDTLWNVVSAAITAVSTNSSYTVPASNTNRFFRVISLSGGSAPVVPQTPAVINSKPVFTNGSLTITWSSTIGASYRVEGKVQANDSQWNVVSAAITAVSTNSSYTVPANNTNRFFRVISLSGGSAPVVPQTPAVINSKPVFTNGSLTITWTSTIGASYRVEGKVQANDSQWNVVSAAITAVSTNSSYTVPANNTNRFFRVISLSGGSAPVVPQTPPVFNSFTRTGLTNGVTLSWQGVAGQRFEVQYSTNMVGWFSLGNNITSSSGVFAFTDTTVASGTLGAKRFYRLLLLP